MSDAERIKAQIVAERELDEQIKNRATYDTAYVQTPFRLEKAHPNRHEARKAAKLARRLTIE